MKTDNTPLGTVVANSEKNWKPAILVWRWEDAPEEFKHLGGFEGPGETVIYVPATLLSDNRLCHAGSLGFGFLNSPKSSDGVWSFAPEGFGSFALHDIPDGGRVAILTASRRPFD